MHGGRTVSPLSACLLLTAALAALPSCERPAENGTREVVLYCSVDQVFARQIVRDFEARTGIKVLVRFDTEADKTTGLVQRLRAEAAAPTADVFWSSEVFQTIRLADEGLLAPYGGEETKGWPAQFADPQRRWHAFALRARVIAFDTRPIGRMLAAILRIDAGMVIDERRIDRIEWTLRNDARAVDCDGAWREQLQRAAATR